MINYTGCNYNGILENNNVQNNDFFSLCHNIVLHEDT